MKKFKAKLTAAFARVPKPVRQETLKVAQVFAVTFVTTASVAAPSVLGQVGAGKLPSFSAVHAVVAASVAAALRASIPVARTAVVRAAFRIVAHVESKAANLDLGAPEKAPAVEAVAAPVVASPVTPVDPTPVVASPATPPVA